MKSTPEYSEYQNTGCLNTENVKKPDFYNFIFWPFHSKNVLLDEFQMLDWHCNVLYILDAILETIFDGFRILIMILDLNTRPIDTQTCFLPFKYRTRLQDRIKGLILQRFNAYCGAVRETYFTWS